MANDGRAVDPHAFSHLSPSRFISFTFPNPSINNFYSHPLLRVAVLDSPIISSLSSQVAAMLVPVGREHDWIFSTQTGHLHLLLSSSSCSRLILVGNPPSEPDNEPKPYARPAIPSTDLDPHPLQRFRDSIRPLLLALSPKSSFEPGGAAPETPFLSYHDDAASIVPVDHLAGPVVGEMLVEDAEIDGGDGHRELRRRLRFKRMPNLVQSQVRLLPDAVNADTFRPETGSLVQPYLGPMAAGLCLLPAHNQGPKMRALCLGVGGGDLLMCLRHRFGFSVVGVEADDVVLRAAKRHFGLVVDEFLEIVVGDAIELMQSRKEKLLMRDFDVIMADLDSGDHSSGIFAPPLEFVDKNVMLSARRALHEKGVMVVNVIPPDGAFYKRLVESLREVFDQLYEIDVGNGENYVLIAAASPSQAVRNENKSALFHMLRQVGAEKFVNCMKKI